MVEMKIPVAGYYMTLDIWRHYIDNQSDKQWLVAFYRLSTTDLSMVATSISKINSFAAKIGEIFFLSKIGIDETDNKFQSIF